MTAETIEPLVRDLIARAARGPIDHWQRDLEARHPARDRTFLRLVAKDDLVPPVRAIVAEWGGPADDPRGLTWSAEAWGEDGEMLFAEPSWHGPTPDDRRLFGMEQPMAMKLSELQTIADSVAQGLGLEAMIRQRLRATLDAPDSPVRALYGLDTLERSEMADRLAEMLGDEVRTWARDAFRSHMP